jgi:hypothetical protein
MRARAVIERININPYLKDGQPRSLYARAGTIPGVPT